MIYLFERPKIKKEVMFQKLQKISQNLFSKHNYLKFGGLFMNVILK